MANEPVRAARWTTQARRRSVAAERNGVDSLIRSTERDYYLNGKVPNLPWGEDDLFLDLAGICAGPLDLDNFSLSVAPEHSGPRFWRADPLNANWGAEGVAPEGLSEQLEAVRDRVMSKFEQRRLDRNRILEAEMAEERAKQEELRRKESEKRQKRYRATLAAQTVAQASEQAEARERQRRRAESLRRDIKEAKFIVEESGGYFNLVTGEFPTDPTQIWTGVTTDGRRVSARGDGTTYYGWPASAG